MGIKGYSAAGITSALKKAGSLLRKGMVAGIFVLTLPIAFVSIIAVIITGHYNRKNVRHVKERLYREAVKKLEAITKALKDEVDSDKERLDYLQSLKILLQRAVNDLKHDLGFE